MKPWQWSVTTLKPVLRKDLMAHLEKYKHQFNDQQQLDRSKLTVDNLPQEVCLAS